ncbi:hypothetical protein EZV73_25585 [Acidaminobacter sp. JC074]|uniref:hypothetical protein n=1 Tax=Acidaminobacter sp. JC074 TaxID=2530199 RepID=UPI001F0F278E|nr:hypothetical protein [Acidaminobacter sp. JC074]MCH4890976.1 hypothetical protein [Acidaminobacter sp. JC074]
MIKYFRNDFIKWHLAFVLPYTLTFIAGLFRSQSTLAYNIHPILGISTFVLPMLVYLFSKDKKLIRGMILNNFNYKGKWPIKIAKLSTQMIIVYFLFSLVTGFVLNNALYGTTEIYTLLSNIHGLARFIVPGAMVTHIGSRLFIKYKRK